MLAVEILFEFPSREIKDQILNNYEHGEGGPRPAEDKAERVNLAEQQSNDLDPIDLDNFGQENADKPDYELNEEQDQDEHQREQDQDNAEPGNTEVQNLIEWTQSMDDMLISNYKNFQGLGAKSCFELLSALIPGTTAKQCYKRGKLLKLNSISESEAKDQSLKLL